MNVLSLFDGMSCGQLALKSLNIKVNNYFASEIDKYAIQCTLNNFPNTKHIGNVFDLDFSSFSNIDLLLGGSPCTYWSISKQNRETTCDGLGFQLFSQYEQALKIIKPKFFLYENNFSIHKNIQEEISKRLGVEPIMIDSAFFTAQKRKRLFWTNIPDIQPLSNHSIFLKDIVLHPFSDNPTPPPYSFSDKSISFDPTNLSPIRIGSVGKGGQGQRIYSLLGKSVNLTANGGGQGAKTGLYLFPLDNNSFIVRKLVPLECERLQGVPDDYTFGFSSTQRYKMLGNGWTIPVISHILFPLSKLFPLNK